MNGQINPVLHAPVRLQIAALLARVEDAEFAILKDVTQVSDSVLSKHLSALTEEGYVKLKKAARDGRQRTWVTLTAQGRRAFAAHMAGLQELVDAAQEASSSINSKPLSAT